MDENQNKEIMICISCMAPNDAAADFCENCNTPLSTTSTLDPMKMIRAEGFALQKSTVMNRPTFIIVFGIWIMFLPALFVGLLLAYSQAFNGEGFAGFVFFWIGIFFVVLSAVILYRVTNNYFAEPEVDQDAETTENIS